MQRPAALPVLDRDRHAGMALDLPRQVVEPPVEGEGGFRQPCGGQHFALTAALPPRCVLARPVEIARDTNAVVDDCGLDTGSGKRGQRERAVAVRVGRDDAIATALALGAQLGCKGQRKSTRPYVSDRRPVGQHRHRGLQQRRGGTAHRRHGSSLRRIIAHPRQPRRLREPRPDARVAGAGAAQAREIGAVEDRIFGAEAIMRDLEDVGRHQPVRPRPPAAAIGRLIAVDDDVEIEHQPVEPRLAQAGAVEQHGVGARQQRRDMRGESCNLRLDRDRQLGSDERAQPLRRQDARTAPARWWSA